MCVLAYLNQLLDFGNVRRKYVTMSLIHRSTFKIFAVESSKATQKKQIQFLSLLLQPVRKSIDAYEIQNPQVAKLLAKLIPAHCPFERDIILFGRKVAHIPPMCKLNPLYEQLVGLRFRALCYLVDRCGEDIQAYC